MFDTKFYEDKIPEHLLVGLIAWGKKEHPVGHFLTAVLSNNLFEAVSRADEESMRSLRHIVRFIYNEMPSQCHGSPEKVKAWQQLPDFGN